jgi:signal transduction histidine kinase
MSRPGVLMTRQLVEAHGGHITVGETPGGGATFKVELPLAR